MLRNSVMRTVRMLAYGLAAMMLAAAEFPLSAQSSAADLQADQADAELKAFVRTALGAPRSWPKLAIPPAAGTTRQPTSPPTPHQIPVDRLVRMMLADTEDAWDALMGHIGRTYEKPWLVLYTSVTPSGCGIAGNKVSGPHYCEIDKKVYLDLAFFEELRSRQGVSGDMPMFYVIGHEIGHHVQRLLGILAAVGRLESRLAAGGETIRRNALSVRVELQADCFAGLVAYHAQRLKQRLESGDVELSLRTAAALGADRLQKLEQGVVQPESFTHGASKQRIRWFWRGLETGALHSCDTFNAADL